jgi:hypothetical protein
MMITNPNAARLPFPMFEGAVHGLDVPQVESYITRLRLQVRGFSSPSRARIFVNHIKGLLRGSQAKFFEARFQPFREFAETLPPDANPDMPGYHFRAIEFPQGLLGAILADDFLAAALRNKTELRDFLAYLSSVETSQNHPNAFLQPNTDNGEVLKI